MSISALWPMPTRFNQRRTFALANPDQQVRLALTVLGISLVFLLLAAVNSYSAYARLLTNVVSASPSVWQDDLVAQTQHYIVVSAALGLGFALAMIGASVAFVNRMVGPMIALNRHVRALKGGRYSSRVKLRGGGGVHAELAQHLNELAIELEDRANKTPVY